MKKLKNKVAIVTGGSRGIGSATAKLFAQEGAKVVIAARSEGGQICADEINANDGEALFIRTDLSDPANINTLVDATVSHFGTVDILVNNAAADDPMNIQGIQDLTLDQYNMVMDINVRAPFLLCQKVIPIMEDKGEGTIVNVASIAATGGGRGPFIYTMAKHALLGLTREIEFLHGRNGIRANSVLPGGVYTELTKADFDNPAHPLAQAIAASPAGRPAQPEELASVILFLSCEDSWFIQGSSIVADGGGTLC